MIRNRLSKFFIALAAAAAVTFGAPHSTYAADKVFLNDGTVLEGEIVREGDGFVFLKVKIGSIVQEKFITTGEIKKIERDAAAKAAKPADTKPEDAAKPADGAKKDEKATPSLSGATKVAILNFGPPSSWQGKVDSMVGTVISAQAFKDVIPKLEKAGVQVVVIRVNSGGGLGLEVPKFQQLFEKEYKPRFRTVAWIESAISAAAMSPYVLEEMYFFREGNLGACTGWYGNLQNVEGVGLEEYMIMMEEASRMGKRDPKIMKAMQVQVPLSATIDETTGEVTWFQDTSGQYVLNSAKTIFTINSRDAVKFKFAKGVADTKEELVKAMGLSEVEWVAQDATDDIDQNMRDNDKSEKTFQNTYQKYAGAVELAAQIQDPKVRGGQIALARRYLSELRRLTNLNPNFKLMRGTDEAWFQQQEETLRELAKPR